MIVIIILSMKCVCCLPDSIEIPFEQKWEKGEDGKLIQHSVVHIKVVAALHSIALFFYFFATSIKLTVEVWRQGGMTSHGCLLKLSLATARHPWPTHSNWTLLNSIDKWKHYSTHNIINRETASFYFGKKIRKRPRTHVLARISM